MTDQRPNVARSQQRATVLVVDHHLGDRAFACGILKSEGFHVLEARDGPTALTVLQQHRSDIWLVLITGLMPGMSGQELAALVSATPSPPQVLLMSAYPPIALTRVTGVGTEYPFLPKPFTAEQLAARVRQMRRECSEARGLPGHPGDG
jgi:two-component system cell cycle sensor histidine kinase/response regulator CckA